mmetsp:Transcript_63596/g.137734  ORF Transcript_63596/g.137734 Transcript_63596/m.137734 type:complete len:299 (+) Transcript_63596:97-993(+)
MAAAGDRSVATWVATGARMGEPGATPAWGCGTKEIMRCGRAGTGAAAGAAGGVYEGLPVSSTCGTMADLRSPTTPRAVITGRTWLGTLVSERERSRVRACGAGGESVRMRMPAPAVLCRARSPRWCRLVARASLRALGVKPWPPGAGAASTSWGRPSAAASTFCGLARPPGSLPVVSATCTSSQSRLPCSSTRSASTRRSADLLFIEGSLAEARRRARTADSSEAMRAMPSPSAAPARCSRVACGPATWNIWKMRTAASQNSHHAARASIIPGARSSSKRPSSFQSAKSISSPRMPAL